ncbi:MAG: hypothetical protein AAFU71_03225 [Cyanobacteria bacterium J06632_22]
MNAAEQASSIEFASKIAAVVRLMKAGVPDLRADLKPWTNDPQTRGLIDPDSIDIGFHFPGVSRSFKCRSLLVQIRFCDLSAFDDTDAGQDRPDGDAETTAAADVSRYRVIGVEVAGFDHRGQRWQLSTIDDWHCEGEEVPMAKQAHQLKQCCREIFEVFRAAH